MKTKTTLLTALVAFAGSASLMAQVYSVNMVGYVNQTIPPGFSMIANQLNTTNNTLGSLIQAPPDFSNFYKFNPGTGAFEIATFLFGSWDHPEYTLNPGEGAFFNSPASTNFVVTFVGEVLVGTLTNSLPAGFSIASSKIPQAGTVDQLGLVVNDFDNLYKFNTATQQYDIYTYLFGSWSGPGGSSTAPSVNVGESFFLNLGSQNNWVRTFTVN